MKFQDTSSWALLTNCLEITMNFLKNKFKSENGLVLKNVERIKIRWAISSSNKNDPTPSCLNKMKFNVTSNQTLSKNQVHLTHTFA